jgi:hypothetical protein
MKKGDIMQEILIKEELLQLVLEGKKTTTCRFGKRDYELVKTRLKSNSTENYTHIDLLDMRFIEAKDITDETANYDGFNTREELITVLTSIYGEIKDTDIITIVYFELSE